jgi:hypothetical protein
MNEEGEKWTLFDVEDARLKLRLSESVLDVMLLEFASEW